MRILMVTSQLPSSNQAADMAPVVRQINSIQALGAHVDILEVKGIPKLKYLQALPILWKLSPMADLIHAHYGYCGLLARCQFGKPLIVSFMGDDLLGTPDVEGNLKFYSKWVVKADRWLARTVDGVIVKSGEMAEVVAPVKVYIVPNGVDLHTFQPMDPHETRASLGLSGGKDYILFPGNPDDPRKGFPLAQAAVKTASSRMSKLLELITLWDVAPDRVPLYMNSCKVMLMTSFIEGSPNVVKEAMACNMPVISVPVGDVPELINGVQGYTICPREADSLAEELVRVLNEEQCPNGREALKHKGLDLESVAHRLMNIYQNILTRRKN